MSSEANDHSHHSAIGMTPFKAMFGHEPRNWGIDLKYRQQCGPLCLSFSEHFAVLLTVASCDISTLQNSASCSSSLGANFLLVVGQLVFDTTSSSGLLHSAGHTCYCVRSHADWSCAERTKQVRRTCDQVISMGQPVILLQREPVFVHDDTYKQQRFP